MVGSTHDRELSALKIVLLIGSSTRLVTISGFVKTRNDTGEQTMEEIVPVHVEGSTVLLGGVDADPSALLVNSCP